MKKIFALLLFIQSFQLFHAQEGTRDLSCNLGYYYGTFRGDQAVKENSATASQRQQQAPSLFLPFVEDFYYATTNKYPSQKLWADSFVFINTGFARAPPSIGVATFDGLNQNGYPYKESLSPNLGSTELADALTSQPINLFTTSSSQTLLPTSKVGLSFYYQARGYGEPPELNDSLLLDFYRPSQQKWSTVWRTKGNINPNTNDSTFHRAFIWIRDTAYLQDGFRFRFRNYATVYGNFDHWHIDYIYLNQGRDSIADTTYNDVTFSRVPTPFLKDYSAMPFRQFVTSEMAKNNTVLMQNNFTQPLNIYYGHKFTDETGTDVFNYTAAADNITPFKYFGYFNNPNFMNPASRPSFTYSFPSPLPAATTFTTTHFVYRNGLSADFIPDNDTVRQYHKFYDYYAYDDGSPEAGYYVNGANGKMALKFRLNAPDTLRALRIYFDPAPIGSSQKYFFKIFIMSSESDAPGKILRMFENEYYPEFRKTGFKEVPEYELPEPLILESGTYFIGIQQQLSTGLVVGFDRNYDSHRNLYYDSGSGFTQSSIRGSLMMHPAFGTRVGDPTGIRNHNESSAALKVFPNPAGDHLTVQVAPVSLSMRYGIYNIAGQLLVSGTIEGGEKDLNTETLPPGLYVLSVTDPAGFTQQKKIIIAR